MSRKNRNHRQPRYQQTRKAFFECLERRDLLAVVPVANNDAIYNTAMNTQLTSSTAVVANDFDVDSLSLTASVVASPSNGTLNSFNTSTGQFTYTPTTSYVGFDTFTYKVNNGTYDSNVATVTISVGGVFGPRTNLDDQPLDSPMYTGANTVVQSLSLGEQLVYRSDTVSLKPVIAVETSLKSGATIPNSIDAVLTFNGTAQSTVSYTNSGLAAGDTLRFALQADATALATGYYGWSMAVTANYTGSTSTSTFTGNLAVVNRATTVFGKGWWLDGLDQLVVSGSGALLVRGNGDTLWFNDNGSGYDKAAGDAEFSTLVENGGGDFTLTTKHGIAAHFSASGLLTSVVDTNGNAWDYSYTDGDSGGTSNDIAAIEEPYGRDFTFSYSSNKVSTFTDYASHATALAYTSGKLTGVTLTDPDSGGGLPAPVWGYAYNGTTGLLETQTDPNSEDTDFVYNSTSLRLSEVDYPDGFDVLLTPVQTYGLKTGSGNALVETVNPLGSYTDQNAHEFKFQMDRFGNVLSFGFYVSGSSGDVTDTSRDPNGLPYKILQPAIGGTRYTTKLGYNALGDVLKIIHPDVTTQTFTYDTTFHNVLTATDEMARVSTFTYDAYGNELTRADNAGNTWTTSYSGRSDGLPTSITSPDPDGAGGLSAYVTAFDYDSYGRLEETTFPDSSTQLLAYNSADMVTSVTDENGNETVYAYDALNRLTSITGEDPDAGGGLSSPVTSFTFDAAGNLLTQVDALSQTTSYAYDERNRVASKTLPDPDSGGSGNPAPVFTYTYDGTGNVIGEGSPSQPYALYHVYDAYGRLTESTRYGKEDDWTYDVLGRMTSYTNSIRSPLYQTETWEYDSRGRVTKHVGHDPDGVGGAAGPTTLYAYNYAGQPASVTDPLGNVTAYDYLAAGWLNSVTLPDPDGSGPLYSPVYTFGYDALGNQTGVTDPNLHMSSKTYDNRGRLASETGADPDGAGGLSAPTTSYGYDDAGNLTSITNPLSKVTSFGYDMLNRKTSMTLADPDGAGSLAAPVYAYGYNAVNSLITETDPLGNVTTRAYDHLNRLTSVTGADPDGGGSLTSPVWTYTFGSDTQLATLTDPMGHDTDYGYDYYGRLSTVTNNDGYVTTTAYNLLDQVTSVTTPDPDGAGGVTASVTAYAYDYLNRLSSTTDALSGVTAFTYDLNGNLINLRDPVNNDTAWAYDGLGRVTMETNELNKTRSFYHDAAGNLTRKMDRNNRVTQYSFDDLGRMTSELWISSGNPVPALSVSTTTPGGPPSEVQRVGFTASVGLGGGTFTLSFGGNTTSALSYTASAATVQSALEGLASIGSGNVSVSKTTDTSTSKIYTVTFQGTLAAANQSQITINTASITAYVTKTDTQATDTQGGGSGANEVQVVTLSNATDGTFRLAFGGQTTAPIAYNASNSTVDTALEALTNIGTGDISVTGSNGGPWTVTFNGGGLAGVNVASLQGDAASAQSGSVSHTISYTYDTASQLTAASDSDGELDFGYDYIGRVTSETQIVDGLTPHIVLATKYDAASNRTELASTLGSNADFKNTYLYDNNNRMTRVTQQSNSGNTLATKRVDFAYNALSQFTQIDRYQNTGGTNEVAATTFTYDTLNRLSTLNHDQGGTTLNHYTYGYDRMDRLNSISSTAEGSETFTYDKTSQLTGADHATQTDETYTFDANGNRTMSGYTTTTNNLTTSDGTYNYTYDDEGNRTRKTNISTGAYEEYTWDYRNRLTNVTSKTSGGTVTKTVDEHYDILNRWTRRHTDPDGPGATAARDNFFAYDGIEPIYQFDGTADTDLIDRYLWGPVIDQILADEQVTSLGAAGNIIHPLTDHLDTSRDLADQNESTHTTTITNHRTFNGYGNLTTESNSAVDCDPAYTGKITDSDTNLQNNVNRWYDAVLGQWSSEDPIKFSGNDPNLRRSVANNVVLFSDPSGLERVPFGLMGGGYNPEPYAVGPTPREELMRRLNAMAREHAGYEYWEASGLNGAMNEMQQQGERVGIGVVTNGNSRDGAIYQRWRNRIYFHGPIDGVMQGTIVHEMFHRIDDVRGITITPWRPDHILFTRNVEGLAYSAEFYYSQLHLLRAFERDITSGRVRTQTQVQARWTEVWQTLGFPNRYQVDFMRARWDASARLRPRDVANMQVIWPIGYEQMRSHYEAWLKTQLNQSIVLPDRETINEGFPSPMTIPLLETQTSDDIQYSDGYDITGMW